MPMAIVAKNASRDFSRTPILAVAFLVTVTPTAQKLLNVTITAYVTVTTAWKVTNVTDARTDFITWPGAAVTLATVT